MPYTSTSFRSPFQVSYKGVFNSADGLVPVGATIAGTFPSKESYRGGSNDPRNFYLLNLLGRTKPFRVRFSIKKIVVGYRYIYKKRWYTQTRQKRVRVDTGRTAYYRVLRKVKRGKNKGKFKWFIRSRKVYTYRYITVHRQRSVKVPIRVPIKLRIRVAHYKLAEGDRSQLPATSRPYLRPNLLTFENYERECYPRTNTSRSIVPLSENGDSFIYETFREGAVSASFGFVGPPVPFSVGVGPFSHDTSRLPPVDDIYLSATSLHGLYKKVASDAPSTLTSLAEAPETIKALYEILKDGIKLAKSLRRLDARSAYRTVNAAVKARNDSLSGVSSKVWLSWYLAVAPTISDIAEHLSLITREDRAWRKFSKSSTEVTRHETTYAVEGFASVFQRTTTVKYGVYINGRLTIDQFKSKVSGSDNLSAALYAVVPFSFIADWIVDVSTYLESAAIFQGLDYDAWKTSCTLEEYVERTHTISSNIPFDQRLYHADTEKENKLFTRRFRVDREPIFGELPSMPLIPWKKRIVDEAKINRSLTAAALFRVLLSKKN